jgi:hypothetical protein
MRWFSLFRRLRVALAVGLVAAGLVLVAGAGAVSAGWRVQPSPDPSPFRDFLTGVAATSSTSAWAVGERYKRSKHNAPHRRPLAVARTLVERWKGRAWTVVPSPNPSFDGDFLGGVAATSSTNAWAVGKRYKGSKHHAPHRFPLAVARTLVEHWNGRAWTVVPSPNPGLNADVLNGVAATSSTDVWAVGDYSNGNMFFPNFQSLVEHWDGTTWTVVPSPSPGGSSGTFLNGVATTSATNAWAVGFYNNGATPQSVIEHWDGTAWAVVPSPNPGGSSDTELNAVAATSSTNAWAVGFYNNGTTARSLIEHWNGTAWTIVPSPNPVGSRDTRLNAVATTSSTNAWAVGFSRTHGLIEHWDGSAWTVVPSPNPGTRDNDLGGVAATSSTNAWAVGSYNTLKTARTLIEHWHG